MSEPPAWAAFKRLSWYEIAEVMSRSKAKFFREVEPSRFVVELVGSGGSD